MRDYPSSLRLDPQTLARLDASRIAVWLANRPRAGKPLLNARSRTSLAALGLEIDGDPESRAQGGALASITHGPRLLWLRYLSKVRRQPSLPALQRALSRAVSAVAPVYRLSNTPGTSGLFTVRPDALLLPATLAPRASRTAASRALGLQTAVVAARGAGRWTHLTIRAGRGRHAIGWRELLRKHGIEAELEFVPYSSPYAFTPNDPMFEGQWNMTRVGAEDAWEHTRGEPRVLVAVIDSGCDLAHADLRHAYVSAGVNANDPSLDGSPIVFAVSGLQAWHGTAVTGVIAAAIDNDIGVAGLAGGCGVLPVALENGSTFEFGEAVRLAVGGGAQVLNISLAIGSYWFERFVRPEIDLAIAAGCLVAAAAGNGDASPLLTPARYAPVMACGASDRDDTRWSELTGDLRRGSHYGDEEYLGLTTGVSVMAPGHDITTTDITGPAGFTPADSPAGDYVYRGATFPSPFGATSAAVPHVTAAAALLMSRYPTLSAAEVRRILERTAEKVGGVPYADMPNYPNGSRHPEMGYGRLNAARALDLGDVLVADWPFDSGAEPSMPPGGNFFSWSDIVLRPDDDGIFEPSSPEEASILEPGRAHVVTVRVRNAGPAVARGVRVDVRATPFVGLEFHWPDDWTTIGMLHVRPTPIDAEPFTLGAGESRLVRFQLSAEQAETLGGWATYRWHPCLLAVATAENDYAFADVPAGRDVVRRRNNLAQRNLSVVRSTRMARLPFVIGHPASTDSRIALIVNADRSILDGELHLVLEDAKAAFPAARKGQAFATGSPKLVRSAGAKQSAVGNHAALRVVGRRAVVELERPAQGRYALSLGARLGPNERRGGAVTVAQVNRNGEITGGATFVLVAE
jgi:subtilisin family serine protease